MATAATAQGEPLIGKIFSDVAAQVRDLSPGELSLRLASRQNLSLGLGVQHSAAFSIATATGKGALPGDVISLQSLADVQAGLNQRLEQVRQEAGELMDHWVAQEATEYRAQLPSDRCMRERPILGVQETCDACGGRRQVTCPSCSGASRVTCTGCGGRGRVTCGSCGGSRSTTCVSCGGAGSHEVREFEATHSDRQSTMNQQHVMVRRVPCSGCGGRGSNSCSSCSDGTQACSGCGGGGMVSCGRCGASGIVPCDTCAATGMTHRTGWIRCAVSRKIHVDVDSTNPEDLQTFHERVQFEQIAAMASETGGVRLNRTKRDGHDLLLSYAASVPAECAEASVDGQTIAIRAYGAQREIFDYHDLVGKLLETDLASLERGLADHSLFRTNPAHSLAGITKKVLSSELHALVAEAPPPPADGTESGDTAARPRVRVGTLIRNSLLLAPVIRLFRRRGIVLKIIMVIVALRLLIDPQVLVSYCFFVCLSSLFEWRYQRAGHPEGAEETIKHSARHSLSERAAQALEAPIAVGMVSRGYVQRASAAIGKAVPRLYGPLVMPMALWITAAVSLLHFVARNAFFQWSPVEKTLLLAGLTGVAWFVNERMALSQLRALLNPILYERLKGQFGRARWLYRSAPVVAFLVAWYIADLAIRVIVHVRFGTPFFH